MTLFEIKENLYSPWGRKELDTVEQLSLKKYQLLCICNLESPVIGMRKPYS